jgi:hypothetical protein
MAYIKFYNQKVKKVQIIKKISNNNLNKKIDLKSI